MPIGMRVRYEVLRRDNYTCQYCNAVNVPLVVDHVYPSSVGGSNDPSNLVAACEPCNTGKGSTLPGGPLVMAVASEELAEARIRANGIFALAMRASCAVDDLNLGHVGVGEFHDDCRQNFAQEVIDRAERLERHGADYWFDDETDNLHVRNSTCLTPVRLVRLLMDENISGHERGACIDQTTSEVSPISFCLVCCPLEARKYNKAAI